MEAAKAGGRGWGVTEEVNSLVPPYGLSEIESYLIDSQPVRKLRLFVSAFARIGPSGYSLDAIERSDGIADEIAEPALTDDNSRDEMRLDEFVLNQTAIDGLNLVNLALRSNSAVLKEIFRDIFENQFRPVAFDPRWRTSDVVGLARAIYDDKAFERMPILADALMDAGCEDEQVISHCRGDGRHVRGWWVVDLILGKE
jgi:hypothetical protein